MMRLRIDGVEVPLFSEDVKLPLYDSRMVGGCAEQREGDRVQLAVKLTPQTIEILGYAPLTHPAEVFNDNYHHGELSVDGVVLLEGVLVYCSTQIKAGERICNMELRSGGAIWADGAATTKLKSSDIVAEHRSDLSSIARSWSDEGAVRYLPVHRDGYRTEVNTGLYEVYHPLLPQDYHPFISVKALVDSVIKRGGYNLRSEFMSSPFFEKLMFSGSYRSIESQEAYATMDFKAVRSYTSYATADALGRVDVCMPESDRSVGAFVDTVSATTVDENGNLCEDAFTTNGCFAFESDRPLFRPKRDISVAFDMHFRYTTEYRMTNSQSLKGFTQLYVGNGCYVDVSLPNQHKDRRGEVVAGVLYKLYIFDYDPTAKYNLTGVGSISSRVSSVKFSTLPTTAVKLQIRRSGSSIYTEYDGDWALYDGYVEEYGEQSVEFTLRTPYQLCTYSSPKIFNDIYFSGAEPGLRLTLHAGCSITPVFGGIVGYGDRVVFEDIANHDISQADIIDAIAKMFNLCIYTHNRSKSIYIEPYDDFFSGDIVDWRTKQRGDAICYQECVTNSFMLTELCYQPSDGAVGYRYDKSLGEFGSWRFGVDSYAAKQSVERRIIPIFSPTASYSSLVGTAPSAELLTVGNRDIVTLDGLLDPRIVLYHGLKPLPHGESWPSPYCRDSYPSASFHSVESGETLCFEDRDGVVGLHRYHDKALKERATCQRLTTDIYLPPEEYVALFDPSGTDANIRSRFRLNIGGDSSLFRLDAVESYDAKSYIARCRFQRLCND